MGLYERIKDLCKSRGITPTALERELGFGRGYIGKLRTINPTADKLQRIADYFGVPLTYFTEPDGVEDFVHQNSYYIDEETVELARKILTDPDYRILYGEVKDSRPEDIRMVADLLHRFKEDARRR